MLSTIIEQKAKYTKRYEKNRHNLWTHRYRQNKFCH